MLLLQVASLRGYLGPAGTILYRMAGSPYHYSTLWHGVIGSSFGGSRRWHPERMNFSRS